MELITPEFPCECKETNMRFFFCFCMKTQNAKSHVQYFAGFSTYSQKCADTRFDILLLFINFYSGISQINDFARGKEYKSVTCLEFSAYSIV